MARAAVRRPQQTPLEFRDSTFALYQLARPLLKREWAVHNELQEGPPARIFDSQDDLLAAFKANELTGDFVAVVRWQGPRANGMPELHKLTPTLAALQDRGQKVALLTDGRMSGASGKVLAAIHVTPEAADAGALAKLREGDIVRIDAEAGTMDALVDAGEWNAREAATPALAGNRIGHGRELFALMRVQVGPAEQGACSLFIDEDAS